MIWKHFSFNRLICVFSIVAILFCLLLSYFYINVDAALILLIFNFLFLSLIFPLKGSSTRKSCLLLIGNVIGFFWNALLSVLAYSGMFFFGGVFSTLYLIINPYINLIWIVSFWSISLAILANPKNERQVLRHAD